MFITFQPSIHGKIQDLPLEVIEICHKIGLKADTFKIGIDTDDEQGASWIQYS